MANVRNMAARGRAHEGFLYLNQKNLRGFSETEIHDLQIAKEKISSVLDKRGKFKNKSFGYTAILVNMQDTIEKITSDRRARIYSGNEVILNLSPEEVQIRRDEVLKMVRNKCPLPGIKKFQGKEIDKDPVKFFKDQYHRYIEKKYPVIYTPDLLKIDQTLLVALRNTVHADAMPLGDRKKITEAIANGIFTDGGKSEFSAIRALATREHRARKRGLEIV